VRGTETRLFQVQDCVEQRINKHVAGVTTSLLLVRDWRRQQEKGNVTERL